MSRATKMLIAVLLSFSTTAFAEDQVFVARRLGQVPPVFVVHGGCRPVENQAGKTEVWLYLSAKPNVIYSAGGYGYISATAYVDRSSGADATRVCNYFRAAQVNQTPIKVTLGVSESYNSIVTAIDERELRAVKNMTTDSRYLENFTTREYHISE